MKRSIYKNHPLEMSAAEFRTIGCELINRLAALIEEMPGRKVTNGENPSEIRALLKHHPLPEKGEETEIIIKEVTDMLFEHSLFNGHPRFWGYITSSAAPIGALADLIASTINANLGAFALSPMATEIELQTIKWLADLIGYDTNCGGLFVSGGNMANFHGFLTARKEKIKGDIRKEGLPNVLAGLVELPGTGQRGTLAEKRFTIYCAKGTHTWIQKAVDLFGFGTDSIQWIDVNETDQMDVIHLQKCIRSDRQQGHVPFLVIGNAGSVSTGVIDPLDEISAICLNENLWFHVDGAYGAPAAMLSEKKESFKGLEKADSIALDPHKWLYSPIEAGCILVRSSRHLHEAFSFHPEYYNFDGEGIEKPVNFHEYGMQNSRGFRALKVWLSLKQAGKEGITSLIRENIKLAEELFHLVQKTSELQAVSQNLSITTFRFVPDDNKNDDYLNVLNERLLNRLQAGGEVFLSNAIVNGCYCLRVCIVNFRTSYSDLEALINIVQREGKKIHQELTGIKVIPNKM